jgi:uncharacterized protein YcbX
MTGRIAALWRHPIKGFTPEALDAVVLAAGAHFPGDRLFAVEDGPSGFDPAAPEHIPKMRFTVLAKIPELARARTLYDEETGDLSVTAEGFPPFFGRLATPAGRSAFEGWLAGFLEEQAPEDDHGPLKVLEAPPGHRFTDNRKGFVSILNLDSVRDLERRLGRPVDPARFRANVQVEGWGPWSEYGLEAGRRLRLGGAELSLLKDIDRCMATHVDPRSGVRDIDMVGTLHAQYGHICCGVYAEVVRGGRVSIGDPASAPQEAPP